MSETFYTIVVLCITGIICLSMVVIQTNINIKAASKDRNGNEQSIHVVKEKECK